LARKVLVKVLIPVVLVVELALALGNMVLITSSDNISGYSRAVD